MTRRAQVQTESESTAGSTTRPKAARAGPANSSPIPGDVSPSLPGPFMASSQTRWETGSENDQTASSPEAARGAKNSTAAQAATAASLSTPPGGTPSHVKATAPRHLRLPVVAWVAVTAAALVANLFLANRLWAWYAFTGLVAASVVLYLSTRFSWDVPDRLLWWTGVPLALHYVGGSLSGIHRIGGPNGLYYAFPWWDNVVHFLGAAAVGVIAVHVLRHRVEGRGLAVAAALAVSLALGVAVELYEFVHFMWLGTVDQGYYTNTMLDLYYNALGGGVAAWAYTRSWVPANP